MRSEAATVEQYLAELPADRREAIEAVRSVILENLPDGYVEVMNWGMITYEVPLETSTRTPTTNSPSYSRPSPLRRTTWASTSPESTCPTTQRDEFEKAYRATGKRFDVRQVLRPLPQAGRPARWT